MKSSQRPAKFRDRVGVRQHAAHVGQCIVDAEARSLRDQGITANDIAKMLGVSRATIYR